jgi:hypothetical protein
MSGVLSEKLFVAKISAKLKETAESVADRYVSSRSFLLSDLISDAPDVSLNYENYEDLPGYSSFIGLFDPNYSTTIDSLNRISEVSDLSPANNDATQSTDANKPVLTRADNLENRAGNSENFTASTWNSSAYPVTTTNNVTTDYAGNSTAGKIVASSGTGRKGIVERTALRIGAGAVYELSVDLKKSNIDYAWIGEDSDSPWHGISVNINTGAFIGTGVNITSKSITSLGSGWFRVSLICTAVASHGPSIGIFFGDNANYTSPPSGISRAGTEEIYIARAQIRLTESDDAYLLSNGGFAQVSGINGKKAFYTDGNTRHLLANGIATALSGTDKPFTVIAVVKQSALLADSTIFALGDSASTQQEHLLIANGSTNYYSWRQGDSGSQVQVTGGTPTKDTRILSWVFTGTTISFYIDGVAVYTGTAQDVVAATFNRAAIGATIRATSALYLNGKFGFLGVSSVAMADDDREIWENFLANRFQNTPTEQPATGYDDIQVAGILREISGFGQSMGEVVADDKFGSIVLDVTRGTTDFDKRFYDIFEKETILNQSVIIYSVEKQRDQPELLSTWEIEFSGIVTGIAIDPISSLMTLSLKSREISYESPNYLLTLGEFADLRSDGIGRYLPLVFNQADVLCSYAEDNGGVTPGGDKFKYASELVFGGTNIFRHGSILNFYSKNFDGVFVEVFSASAKTTIYLGRDIDGSAYVFPASNAISKGAWDLGWSASEQRIYVQGFVYFKDKWSNTPQGSISVELWEKGPNGGPIRLVASCRKDKEGADFSWANDLKDQIVKVSFEKPIVLDHGNGYFMSAEQNSQDGSDTLYLCGTSGTSRSTWQRDDSVWSPYINDFDGGGPNPYYGLRALVLEKETGAGDYTSLAVYQDDLNPSTDLVSVVPLNNLEIIVKSQGLKDDASGTISGTAGKVLTSAYEIVRLLYYCSNGCSFDGLDTSTFNPQSYAPEVAGATEGRQDYRNIILEILENSASKLVPRRGSDSLALWCYGVMQETACVFTESDCRLISFEISALDQIVNRVRVAFDKSAVPLQYETDEAQGNYRQTFEAESNISISLYGLKDLSNDFIKLNYVKDEATAERWAQYKLAQYSKERTIVVFEVPFWKDNYRSVDLMDIVELSHTANPSYFGSAPPYQEPALTEDGENIGDDYMIGDLWRRAKRFKLRILGRTPLYSINDAEARIQFKALVLDNPDEIF